MSAKRSKAALATWATNWLVPDPSPMMPRHVALGQLARDVVDLVGVLERAPQRVRLAEDVAVEVERVRGLGGRAEGPVHDRQLAGALDLAADVAVDTPGLDALAAASDVVEAHVPSVRGGRGWWLAAWASIMRAVPRRRRDTDSHPTRRARTWSRGLSSREEVASGGGVSGSNASASSAGSRVASASVGAAEISDRLIGPLGLDVGSGRLVGSRRRGAVRQASLRRRLEQEHRAGHGRVERSDAAPHGDARQRVDTPADSAVQAPSLAADDDGQRTAQVQLPHGQRGIAVGADDAQPRVCRSTSAAGRSSSGTS